MSKFMRLRQTGPGETANKVVYAHLRPLPLPWVSSTHCDTLEIGNELVAQSVEQRTFNAWVVGSIPTELTTFRSTEQPVGVPSPPETLLTN